MSVRLGSLDKAGAMVTVRMIIGMFGLVGSAVPWEFGGLDRCYGRILIVEQFREIQRRRIRY